MNTEEDTMKSEADTQLLTAEELVKMRKQKDEQSLPNLGLKYSVCSKTPMEEEDLNCALASYRDILTQKRSVRICDLIQAHWDEDLKAVVTTKLKGKFVQHMGRRTNDKIVLSSEESLFLLENGCIEIMNGKTPMSTEEAYSLLLKEHLSIEKYQVFSHLSQLGFIVVPHQKELGKQLLTKKSTDMEKKQKKRKIQSPLPEKSNSKRLTFSGIFQEESEADKASPTPENCLDSSLEETSKVESQTHSTNEVTNQPKQTTIDPSEKEVCEVSTNCNLSPILVKPAAIVEDSNIENKESFPVESQSDDRRSESVNSLSRSGLEEMEIDCHSADIALEESRGIKESFDNESNSISEEIRIINSGKEVNEDTSEVIYCSSSLLNESLSEDSTSNNLCIDDEVTLVEVKKKETMPLAVIDLLSDDEAPDEEMEEHTDSDDDEIKIIKVCNNPLNKDKSAEIPLNLNKIKIKKAEVCKAEASDRQSTVPSFQFPDIFRKDLVCVPRPPLNLLPLHVQPKKEAYILDLGNHSDQQADKSFRPSERLWNSYKDMQDYQRARRRNRPSDHHSQQFQNRNRRPWQKNFEHNNGTSREHNQPFPQTDFSSRHSTNSNRWNLSSPGNRLDMNNYDSNYSHSRQSDTNFLDSSNSRYSSWRSPAVALDQKPNSPTVFGNVYEQRNFSDHPFPNPQLPSEMHGTAYSYSTSMFASMFGQSLNTPLFRPFQPGAMMSPALLGRHVNDLSWNPVNNNPFSNPFSNNNPFPNSNPFPNNNPFSTSNNSRNDYHPNGRHNRNSSFPCQYRYVNNKTSWNDVRTVVRNEDVSSSNNVNEVEELPPDINEFLWNFSNISPLIKPGTKYAVSDALEPLKLTHTIQLTDKNSKYSKCLPSETILEITYDVYLPGTNFKKSSPSTPKHRIIVVRAKDPIPRYSEVAVLQKKWNDGAILQIAVVDNTDIAFCCFNSISLPCLIPFEE